MTQNQRRSTETSAADLFAFLCGQIINVDVVDA